MNKGFRLVSILIIVAMTLMISPNISDNNTVDAAEAVIQENIKTITSNGTSSIEVLPDVAYITVGVVAEGKELTVVQEEANKNMTSAINELKKLGIDEKDIKTLNFNISPNYDWSEKSGGKIIGYVINNMVEVTINDLTKVGTIIDKVASNGSNSVSNLRFGLKDESVIYNKALELAVKDAKLKAESMGLGIGVTNMSPIKIVETSQRNNTMIYREAKAVDMAGGKDTPINTGEIKINASVTVDLGF